MNHEEDDDIDFDSAFDAHFFDESPAIHPKPNMSDLGQSVLPSTTTDTILGTRNTHGRHQNVSNLAEEFSPAKNKLDMTTIKDDTFDSDKEGLFLPPIPVVLPLEQAKKTLSKDHLPLINEEFTSTTQVNNEAVSDTSNDITNANLPTEENTKWQHILSMEKEHKTKSEPSPNFRKVRKSTSAIPEDHPVHKSLDESKRQELWQSLHNTSGVSMLSIAPVKRVSYNHIIEDKPKKSSDPVILQTIDQKLASFASYLGETNILKNELEAAHLASATYEEKVNHLQSTIIDLESKNLDQQNYITMLENKLSETQRALEILTAEQIAWQNEQEKLRVQRDLVKQFHINQFKHRKAQKILALHWNRWKQIVHYQFHRQARATSKMAVILLNHAEKRHQLDRGLHCLRSFGCVQAEQHQTYMANSMLVEYRRHARETSLQCLSLVLIQCCRLWRKNATQRAFQHWNTKSTRHAQVEKNRNQLLYRLCQITHRVQTKAMRFRFEVWIRFNQQFELQKAITTASTQVEAFQEAKECIFELSRQKSKLEDAVRTLENQTLSSNDTIAALKSELQLNKHGFVVLAVRSLDKEWSSRWWFNNWKSFTSISKATKSLETQVSTLQTQVDEQIKFTKSLDQYNKVLQSDVERYQFLTHDSRVAVEALTKKLLREETRTQECIQSQNALQTMIDGLCIVQSSSTRWTLPFPLLLIGKELLVEKLTQIFSIHSDELQDERHMSWDSCYELVQSTLSQSETSPTDTLETLSQLESFFPNGSMSLPDFVRGLQAYIDHVLLQTKDPSLELQLSQFWRNLLQNQLDDNQGSWTRKNKLSDDIIQNQEKLLAVLEHETAVVERAVLEKASLKHTYPTDTVPEPLTVPATDDAMAWFDLPQVRDLILAYQIPLVQLYQKYSTHYYNSPLPSSYSTPFERQLNSGLPHAMAMHLQGLVKLFEDLKLYPVVFTSEVVAQLFGDVVEQTNDDKVLTCHNFVKVFGGCILHTYASRPTTMSIREKLHTFFYELDLNRFPSTTNSTSHFRNPKPCYVGQEVEAILWPLFDYFATGGERSNMNDEARISMTVAKFCRFMTEIAGVDKETCRTDGELMFRKAVRISRGSTLASRMVFDEFYMGIYYMHQLKDTTRRYDSPGDALKEWMAQL